MLVGVGKSKKNIKNIPFHNIKNMQECKINLKRNEYIPQNITSTSGNAVLYFSILNVLHFIRFVIKGLVIYRIKNSF